VTMKDRITKATTNTVMVFKSLDQMAANDEYVNSDGLNVKRRESHHSLSKNRRSRPTTPPNDNDYVTNKKPPTFLQKEETHNNDGILIATRKKLNGINNHGTTRHHDDEDENIIYTTNENEIMDRIQMNQTKIKMLKDVPTRPTDNHSKRMERIGPQRDKDPNRFLKELDARISKPLVDVDAVSCNSPPLSRNQKEDDKSIQMQGLDFFKKTLVPSTSHSFHWLGRNLQNSLSQYIPHSSVQGPIISDSLQQPKQQQQQKKTSSCFNGKTSKEDMVTLIQSDAILGDDDNEELLRIRQRMNVDVISVALDMFYKNRQYVGVLVTFVIMTVGYFWFTRRKLGAAVYE